MKCEDKQAPQDLPNSQNQIECSSFLFSIWGIFPIIHHLRYWLSGEGS